MLSELKLRGRLIVDSSLANSVKENPAILKSLQNPTIKHRKDFTAVIWNECGLSRAVIKSKYGDIEAFIMSDSDAECL